MSSKFLLILVFLTIGFSYIKGAPSTSRVVGGEDANLGQFPHQISLQRDNGKHTCGGSILNDRYILTAAHCVVVGSGIEGFPARFFQVRVGSIQRTMGGQLRKIKRIIVNKTYGNFLNDVALLELEQPLKWSKYVKPIEMATEEVPAGENVIISGWGRLYRNGPLPNRLQWNTLKRITTDECAKSTDITSESLLCLSHPIENGACNGDSGGPAIYNSTLVGVAGFVTGGCGSQYPDGYAKVSYHRQWILDNMNL